MATTSKLVFESISWLKILLCIAISTLPLSALQSIRFLLLYTFLKRNFSSFLRLVFWRQIIPAFSSIINFWRDSYWLLKLLIFHLMHKIIPLNYFMHFVYNSLSEFIGVCIGELFVDGFLIFLSYWVHFFMLLSRTLGNISTAIKSLNSFKSCVHCMNMSIEFCDSFRFFTRLLNCM